MIIQTPFVRRLLPLALACGLAAMAPATQAQPAPDLFTPLPTEAPRGLNATQRQYLGHIEQRPTTISVTLGRVDVAALERDKMRITVSPTKALVLTKDEVTARDEAGFTWVGSFPGASGQTILVVSDGNITGTIRDETTFYQLEPVGGGMHALVAVDPSRFPPDDSPEFNREQKRRRTGPDKTPVFVPRTNQSLVEIDVLVAYTTKAKATVADIDAMVDLAIAETNQAYKNSGIAIELKLVDSFELVGYSETGKSPADVLADFKGRQEVNTRRAFSGADVAVLLENLNTDNCGLADVILAGPSTAFAVVKIYCAAANLSFAHEVGHLQGARHNPENDTNDWPFSYGHGLQHPASNATQRFRTVMAYPCTTPCDPRISYFSTPNRSYNGVPVGTAARNDNARVLNETAKQVADFMNRPFHGYRFCALEHGRCGFYGTKNVAYGANGKFYYKTAAGGLDCNNGTFGDPIFVNKACYVGPEFYDFCAKEGERCNFTGTMNVAYGTDGKFFYRTATSGIDCNNGTFGDPIKENKACYVGPVGTTFCATQDDQCSFVGSKTVVFGTHGYWVSTRATDGVRCDTSTFGEVVFPDGVKASCYIVVE
ncbi:MAG TPA: M12 family metallo-peptidase [Thermoanaerobaculia bacterium]|nr:M12 family metallo-peptidase [Thermoanaerobaculia bacterium]